MKVLWTVNILLPEAQQLLTGKDSALVGTGGWLEAAASQLAAEQGIELHIASPSDGVEDIVCLKGKAITYYLFPFIRDRKSFPRLDSILEEIVERCSPDVIDIHGTEYAHSLSCAKAAGSIPCAVTIQGLVSNCALHYHDGLSVEEIRRYRHPFHRDILFNNKLFAMNSDVEREAISLSGHIIGRTTWDKALCLEINPRAAYHVCNETLRPCFYQGKWSQESCHPHRIFVSQGNFPIKGLHQMLKAMPAILKQYPDSTLYVGGESIIDSTSGDNINYSRIIKALIHNLKLEGHVFFTGRLDAQQMKEQFLRSNVFVSPSTIENSSNSIAEAQLLGVPCVASCVGGIPDMIPDRECGRIYRFEDVFCLSRLVCDIFEQGWDNTHQREVAAQRHNPENNCRQLMAIYQSMVTA